MNDDPLSLLLKMSAFKNEVEKLAEEYWDSRHPLPLALDTVVRTIERPCEARLSALLSAGQLIHDSGLLEWVTGMRNCVRRSDGIPVPRETARWLSWELFRHAATADRDGLCTALRAIDEESRIRMEMSESVAATRETILESWAITSAWQFSDRMLEILERHGIDLSAANDWLDSGHLQLTPPARAALRRLLKFRLSSTLTFERSLQPAAEVVHVDEQISADPSAQKGLPPEAKPSNPWKRREGSWFSGRTADWKRVMTHPGSGVNFAENQLQSL